MLDITVEGLTDDYLRMLEPLLTEGGFKRLMRQGVTVADVNYGPNIDPVAAIAMLQTGASPMVNGIPAAYLYSPTTNTVTPTLTDTGVMGNFTDETYSPRAVKTSTLADELRIDTDGDGIVYALAANPQMAVVAAGHAGNGAFWIYDNTGNWATSTYYRDAPSAVNNRNYRNPLKARLDTMKWTPLHPVAVYPLLSTSQREKPFKHSFTGKNADRFVRFKQSPLANTEITDLALELIESARLGRDDNADMLNLSYSVVPESATKLETMDAYLRLDRDLNRLFLAMDRAAGTGRSAVILSAVPSVATNRPDDKKWNVPSGEYSVKKAVSLLNMYLMATYGNGDWLSGYYNKQFYLNHKLITDSGHDPARFRSVVAEFLARMAGVSNVFTIDDVLAARAGEQPEALKRNTPVQHSGDVFIEINPGWTIVDDPTAKTYTKGGTQRATADIYPTFILAPSLKPAVISQPVDARAIANAVAGVLRVRPPAGASVNTLKLD